MKRNYITFQDDSYEIRSIFIDFDEDGIPVDIILTSDSKDTLCEIADKHCRGNCAVQEQMMDTFNYDTQGYEYRPTGIYEMCYSRLDSFRIGLPVNENYRR